MEQEDGGEVINKYSWSVFTKKAIFIGEFREWNLHYFLNGDHFGKKNSSKMWITWTVKLTVCYSLMACSCICVLTFLFYTLSHYQILCWPPLWISLTPFTPLSFQQYYYHLVVILYFVIMGLKRWMQIDIRRLASWRVSDYYTVAEENIQLQMLTYTRQHGGGQQYWVHIRKPTIHAKHHAYSHCSSLAKGNQRTPVSEDPIYLHYSPVLETVKYVIAHSTAIMV